VDRDGLPDTPAAGVDSSLGVSADIIAEATRRLAADITDKTSPKVQNLARVRLIRSCAAPDDNCQVFIDPSPTLAARTPEVHGLLVSR
jgi:hypothetical protein